MNDVTWPEQGPADYAGRALDDEGRPLGYPLAGPDEDPEEPPEDDAALDALLDGPPGSLHRMGEDEQHVFDPSHPEAPRAPEWPLPTVRRDIATEEYPNGRPIDPQSLRDRIMWGGTVAFLLDVGQASEETLSDLDARCLAEYRRSREVGPSAPAEPGPWAADFERAPLEAVDADDDRFGEALYEALRREVGDLIPEWQYLSDYARDVYRRQGRFVRERVGAVGAVEPQRVVVGFGDPAVAGEVVETLRRWRDDGMAYGEVQRLIERIEQGS